MKVDYIILGQGICGTFLSWELIKAGKTVMVIDQEKANSSTKVASGVINPITGRRLVRTWEIETFMPFAVQVYQQFGKELNIPLIRQTNILDFHPTPQMVLAFSERQPLEKAYLKTTNDPDQWKKYFHYDFTIGEIDPCWLIDLNIMLSQWRSVLKSKNALLETEFKWEYCKVSPTHVVYGNITAEKIICCDGVAGVQNTYFQLLPYSMNKGEALIVQIQNLPQSNIYKQGYVMVPWKKDHFWVGSTYQWDFENDQPTATFRKSVEAHLKKWLKLPFETVEHLAAIRPANMERKPFVGLHPVTTSIGIFNGMGTKGCSLAPYFAKQLSDHLVDHTPILPEANVQRFTKVLSR